jgi:hypothetical protein
VLSVVLISSHVMRRCPVVKLACVSLVQPRDEHRIGRCFEYRAVRRDASYIALRGLALRHHAPRTMTDAMRVRYRRPIRGAAAAVC